MVKDILRQDRRESPAYLLPREDAIELILFLYPTAKRVDRFRLYGYRIVQANGNIIEFKTFTSGMLLPHIIEKALSDGLEVSDYWLKQADKTLQYQKKQRKEPLIFYKGKRAPTFGNERIYTESDFNNFFDDISKISI